MKSNIGNIVKTRYGHIGKVTAIYNNWEDLKSKCDFVTIAPDNESNEMDFIEKLIKGDPKDEWLSLQKIPFTEKQLKETWYCVEMFDGGESWNCQSTLTDITHTLN
jgi:hypothetical protein